MSTGTSDTLIHAEKCRRPLIVCALVIVMIALAIRLAFILKFNLFVDEAIYIFIAEHSPLTFTPHPPGVPWMVHFGTLLLGRNEPGVRMMSFLLGAGFPLVAWLFGRSVIGQRSAVWSVILLSLIPVYNAFGSLATPDMPQLFLWTCMLGVAWRAVDSGRTGWWIGLGVLAAFVLSIKYVAVLFFPALLLFLLLSGQWRRHFCQPGIYLMCLVTALLMGVLIAVVGVETFVDGIRYHLSERQTFKLESLKDISLYYAAHLAYFSPIIYFLALGGMVWSGIRGIRSRDSALLFLFSFAVTPWLFFSLISAVTARVLNREHWDSLAYVTAVMAGVLWVQDRWSLVAARRILVSAAALAAVTLIGVFFEAATAIPSGWVRQRAAFSSLKGWDQLSGKIDSQMAKLPAGSFVLMSSFPLMVEHSFYTRRQDPIYTVPSNRDQRYGIGVVWDESQVSEKYLSQQQGKDGLFVFCDPNKDDATPKRVTKWTQNLHYRFEAIEYVTKGEVKENSTLLLSYFFLHGHNLRDDSLWLAQKRLEKSQRDK